MVEKQGHLMSKINRLTRIGEWAASMGLLLALAVFAYAIWLVTVREYGAAQTLTEDYGFGDLGFELTNAQQWVALGFWLVPDVIGIWMLLVIRRLFIGLRNDGVFIQLTAKRLRLIGWLVVLTAPVGMAVQMVGSAVLSAVHYGDKVSVFVGIEDSDVYAIVIGLLLVVVAQIMLEAIRIHQENDAFV